MKKLLLVGVLLLIGCDNMFPILSPKLEVKEVMDQCAKKGGKLDTSGFYITLTSSIWSQSVSVTMKCETNVK